MHAPLEQLRHEIGASLRGLDVAQTQLRTGDDPARWSVQQIVEHLLLTYALTGDGFAMRIAKGSPTRTRPTLRQRAAQSAVCRFGYFPHGRLSPEKVAPADTGIPASGVMLTARASEALMRMENLTTEIERLFGSRRVTTHHVLGPLNTRQWMRFHLVHGRHHLRQIRAIRAAHGVQG